MSQYMLKAAGPERNSCGRPLNLTYYVASPDEDEMWCVLFEHDGEWTCCCGGSTTDDTCPHGRIEPRYECPHIELAQAIANEGDLLPSPQADRLHEQHLEECIEHLDRSIARCRECARDEGLPWDEGDGR